MEPANLYVETVNVDAGQSDGLGLKKVKVVVVVTCSSHKSIVYPAAVISATKNKQAAEDFLKYLHSSDAQQVFIKDGFLSLAK